MDYRNGCRLADDCMEPVAEPGGKIGVSPVGEWDRKRIPIAIPSLDPDIPAAWTIESWANGSDPAMDAIAKAISGNSPDSRPN